MQDLIAVYRDARRALRLRAPSRPHRGRHGLEGHRRVVGRARHPAAAGHRRHDPRLADARARRRPHAGSARSRRSSCRPWASAPSCRWSPPARAAAARPRPCSRNWRATSRTIIRDAMPDWKTRYPGVETLNVAVMGCIVNGPGECKHADIGISLPGTGEAPAAPVFIDGKKAVTLRGPTHRRRIQGAGRGLRKKRFGGRGIAAQSGARIWLKSGTTRTQILPDAGSRSPVTPTSLRREAAAAAPCDANQALSVTTSVSFTATACTNSLTECSCCVLISQQQLSALTNVPQGVHAFQGER